jgi:phospholipid-binding lipoprotein MlaA
MAMIRMCALAAGLTALAGCATAPPNPEADPFEPFNRRMYGFNDSVDRTVFEPAARGYRAVTNEPIRQGVRNFLDNLGEPVTFANEVLQGKAPEAAGTLGRFVINTTVGVAGLFNPAGALGIPRTEEDFGQTLGVWGVAPGPYLVMPFLGSTSPRDLGGLGADIAMNPLNYAEFEGDDAFNWSRRGLAAFSGREGALETVDEVRATQLDPYTTLRRFHVRNRQRQIDGSLAPQETLNQIEQVPEYELEF